MQGLAARSVSHAVRLRISCFSDSDSHWFTRRSKFVALHLEEERLNGHPEFGGMTYDRVTSQAASSAACYMVGDVAWARFDDALAISYNQHKCGVDYQQPEDIARRARLRGGARARVRSR